MNENVGGMGHNNPPPHYQAALEKMRDEGREYIEASKAWLRSGILREEDASMVADQITGLRSLRKRVDAARVAAKRPYDEAAKKAHTSFTPIIDALERSIKDMLAMQAKWLQERQRELEEKQRLERLEAQRIADEAAAKLAKAEESGDTFAQVEAEEAAKAAEKAIKAASKDVKVNAGSASGVGRTVSLRTVVSAEVTNIRAACLHFQNHPDLHALIKRLAEAEFRAAKGDIIEIAGVARIETKVAA